MKLWRNGLRAISQGVHGPSYGNIHEAERVVSLLGGLGLGIETFRSHGAPRVVFGALAFGLVWRGITGHSRLYALLGINTARPENIARAGSDRVSSIPHRQGVTIRTSMVIDRPLHEVFAMWRDLEQLPRRLTHLESVERTGPETSHWVARGPFGYEVEWDAELVNLAENERIAWRSLPGSEIAHAGSLHFEPAKNDRTVLHVHLKYNPPAGVVGSWVAKLFGEDPSEQIHEDLLRFKDETEGRPPRGGRIH